MNNRGRLFVLSGSSGGGKTTIIQKILGQRSEFVFSVSSTTRTPRPHETDGVDYHFLSMEEFKHRIEQGKFLEWAEVHGEYYGTEKNTIERSLRDGKNVILDIDVQGGESVIKLFPESILIFIYPPSIEELEKRLVIRGTNTAEQISKRLSRYPFEKERGEKYPYRVLNDDIDRTVKDVLNIIDNVSKTDNPLTTKTDI